MMVYQLAHVERERWEPEWFTAELSIEYLRLFVFGHFHQAWYFTLYALEMQYVHPKTEAPLLTDAFVC